RNAYGGQHFAGFEGGEICALIKLARGNPPSAALAGDVIGRAEAHHYGRHVIAGISVGDIATERAEIADLRVSDLQRGFAKERNFVGEKIGRDQLVLRSHGANDDVVAVSSYAFEFTDAGEIDQVAR